jgi:hypothetical protein
VTTASPFPSARTPDRLVPDVSSEGRRRHRGPTGRRLAAVLGATTLVVLSSGCWRLIDSRPLVLWTTVGVPVQVCNTGRDDDLDVSAEMHLDWGDGTDESAFLAWDRWDGHCYWHAYTAPGTYQGRVWMDPAHPTEGEQPLTVTVAPAAGHLRATGTAATHTQASFAASGLAASTEIIGRAGPAPVHHWDFGDGTTAVTSAAMTTHTYATPGTYRVQVTVTRAFEYDFMTMYHEATAWSTTSVRVGA